VASSVLEILCGAIGVFLLGVTVWAGFAGSAIISFNFEPTFVYVVFGLGFAAASVLLGDIYRAFNPWRASGRVVGRALRPLLGSAAEPIPYPAWLGRWPAAVGIFAFVWLENVAVDGQRTTGIATAILVYSAFTWLGQAVYGVEQWSRNADAFGGYFNLFSRIAPLERRGDQIGWRVPLSGLARSKPEAGLAALVLVMIGTVSFDGASGGPVFQSIVPTLQDLYAGGIWPLKQIELTFGTGMVVMVAAISAFYWLGINGIKHVDGTRSAMQLGRLFAPTLVPIAFAYAGAHYVSLLVLGGQAIAPLASDPLGNGWDLFGTADWKPNLALVGANTFWYIQVALVVLGHVAGLVLAHERALSLYRDPKQAARSQYCMLAVMIGFTFLALWLLNQLNEA
jgi:hypothetical protein